MADIVATIKNKSGQTVALTLDEADERVEYFKKLVKRDELDSVTFGKPKGAKSDDKK